MGDFFRLKEDDNLSVILFLAIFSIWIIIYFISYLLELKNGNPEGYHNFFTYFLWEDKTNSPIIMMGMRWFIIGTFVLTITRIICTMIWGYMPA